MFRKVSKLDKALDHIIKLEERKTAAVESLEAAKSELRKKIQENLESDSTTGEARLQTKVAGCEAALDGINKLIAEAQDRAKKEISAGRKGRREKIVEVETRIQQVTKEIHRRRLVKILEFAKAHELPVDLPTRYSGGRLRFPAVGLADDEIAQIAGEVSAKPFIDPKQADLDSLWAEYSRLETLAFSGSETAIGILLHKRRQTARANG